MVFGSSLSEKQKMRLDEILIKWNFPSDHIGYVHAKEVVLCMAEEPTFSFQEALERVAAAYGCSSRSLYRSIGRLVARKRSIEKAVQGSPSPKKFILMCLSEVTAY